MKEAIIRQHPWSKRLLILIPSQREYCKPFESQKLTRMKLSFKSRRLTLPFQRAVQNPKWLQTQRSTTAPKGLSGTQLNGTDIILGSYYMGMLKKWKRSSSLSKVRTRNRRRR